MPELPLRNLYWILIFRVRAFARRTRCIFFFFFVKKRFYPYKIHRDLAHIKSNAMITRAYIDKFHAISLGQISFRGFFFPHFFLSFSLVILNYKRRKYYEVYLTRIGIAVAIGVNFTVTTRIFF